MPRKAAAHASRSKTKSRPRVRSIWSGSISFGLLQIPISLHTAEERKEEVHFHLLDKRDLSRVRYERVNEKTKRKVEWKDIVKGYELESDEYVVVDAEDLAKANVKATKTIDIQDFVPVDQIDPIYFETPYFVLPEERSAKAYVLLRDALEKKGAAAVASFVLRTREHLAALIPVGDALVLEVLRFGHELKTAEDLGVPKHSKHATPRELDMAEKLIDGMMTDWKPEKYKDRYFKDIMAIIKEKAKTGATTPHHEPEEVEAATNVVDLFDLLKKSLDGKGKSKTKKTTRAKRAA